MQEAVQSKSGHGSRVERTGRSSWSEGLISTSEGCEGRQTWRNLQTQHSAERESRAWSSILFD
eukprot:3748700-Rhodomonas_salina.1